MRVKPLSHFLTATGIFLVMGMLQGCSSFTLKKSAAPTHSASSVSTSVGDATIQERGTPPPFSVAIAKESYDGETLRVSLDINSSKGEAAIGNASDKPVDARIVALRLRLLNEEQIVTEEVQPFISLQPGVTEIAPGVTYRVALQAKGKPLSNYQVELLWGEDALKLLQNREVQTVQASVESTIKEPLPIKEGQASGNEVQVVARVRLVNHGSTSCDAIVLETRLNKEEQAWGQPSFETVAVPNLVLKAGEAKLIQVRFKKAVAPDFVGTPEINITQCSL